MLVRKYLYHTIAVISFSCIASLLVWHRFCTAQKPTITIIGAGLAGLSTAYELHKRGFSSIDVYEAKQRVGGRTFSVEFVDPISGAKTYSELGAENIYDGGQARTLRSLIDDLQLEYVDTTVTIGQTYYYTGSEIINPYSLLTQYYTPQALWDHLQELGTSAHSMRKLIDGLFNDTRLKGYFTQRLTCYEGGTPVDLSPEYITTLFSMVLGSLSKNAAIRYCRIKGGNQLITQRMAATLAGHIHLGQALKKIEKTARDTYQLTFATGLIIETDSIVLAIPATVYKDIEFGPDVIPQATLDNIKAIHYGKHSKIVLPVARKDTMHAYCTDYMAAWYGRHADYLTMLYCNEQGYFTSDTIASIVNRDVSLMRKVYDLPSSFSLPVTADDVYGHSYTGPVGHCWQFDPYAQGSYSYIAAGQEDILIPKEEHAGHTFRKLFIPLNNDTLFFAGEHTTLLLDVLGTMEAAAESGIRTADSIAMLYDQSDTKYK
jgi:monoamine oxidase